MGSYTSINFDEVGIITEQEWLDYVSNLSEIIIKYLPVVFKLGRNQKLREV